MPSWLKTVLGILVILGKKKGVIPADVQVKPGPDLGQR
jgi:hypothetical protein